MTVFTSADFHQCSYRTYCFKRIASLKNQTPVCAGHMQIRRAAEWLFTSPEAVVFMRPITASQKFHITFRTNRINGTQDLLPISSHSSIVAVCQHLREHVTKIRLQPSSHDENCLATLGDTISSEALVPV